MVAEEIVNFIAFYLEKNLCKYFVFILKLIQPSKLYSQTG